MKNVFFSPGSALSSYSFSLASSKLIPYIAPIFLAIALIFGHVFRRYEDVSNEADVPPAIPMRYRVTVILQSLLFVAALIARFFFASMGLIRESGGPGFPSRFSFWS